MDELANTDRKALLRLVRTTLRAYLTTGKIPPEPSPAESLDQPAGSFVTLKTLPEGHLRGCIGTFSTDTPLHRCVQEMAVSAASRDPRFGAVELDELDHLGIEISVLSPRRIIDDAQTIEVGRHGVCISRGMHRGVLLPQVPVEHGWDRDTFLEHLCLKAGLPTDAWRQADTVLEVFTAEVFGEGDAELQDP